MRDLNRTAYQRMLEWKQRPDHKTLEVSGARQVGKTYLVNKFADEHAKREHEKNFCTCRHCQGCSIYCSLMQNYCYVRTAGTGQGAARH